MRQVAALIERQRCDPSALVQRVKALESVLQRLPDGLYPAFRAAVLNDLGNAYSSLRTGDRGDNLRQAIACFQQTFRVYTPDAAPLDYAMTQHNLGNAYNDLPTGDRGENLQQAIACYREALRFRTPDTAPFEYAATQNGLGNAYSDLPMGDRGENLHQAIACYREALRFYTPDATPFEYAATQNNLGAAYYGLPTGDWGDNLRRAIAYFQQALLVYTPEAAPLDYAMIQHNLGNAYLALPTGDRGDNLHQAIACYRKALRFYTPDAAPFKYAATQNNLGAAYRALPTRDRGENVQQAIACYREALRFYTPDAAPLDYAMTQHNLGNAYNDLPTGDRGENLHQAIACYREALRFRTLDAAPFEYARTQNYLGTAYRALPTGDRSENVQQAIACHREALRFYTPDAAPFEYAATQNGLGLAYSTLQTGDRGENVLQAITCFQQALRVYTPEAAPFDYAMTQHNLGLAYSTLPTGDRGENVLQAIACCREALRFYTLDATPFDYAGTQNILGNAYSDLLTGDRGENVQQAIDCYREALRFYTPDASPLEYAGTQNNLGLAYRALPTGDRGENVQQAIACHREALRFRRPEAAPLDYALTQNNLGLAYSTLPTGDRGENVQQAIACYHEALRFCRPDAAPQENRRANRNLANLYFGEQRWAEALKTLQATFVTDDFILAAAHVEASRQTEVSETRALYVHAAYCLLQTSQPGPALAMLERGKTRLLAQALALTEVDLQMLAETQRQQLHTVRQSIYALEGKMRLLPNTPTRQDDRALSELLREKRAELNALIDTIRQAHPDFMPIGLDLPEILALIPKDGVLVAPLVTSQGGVVFVVPHGLTEITEAHVIRLDEVKIDDLNAFLVGDEDKPGWLRAYITYRNNKDLRAWQTALEAFAGGLWNMLIAPVHERLVALNAKRVLIMPSGGLQLLPLHAAWCMVDGQKRALLDDYEVTYAPSAYVLNVSRQRAAGRKGKTALVAGINAYEKLGKLVNAVPEAQAIGQVLTAKPLLDSAATEDAVKANAKGAAYLHLSCHGSFAWGENPLNSAIYLANDEPLTLAEIITQLDLSAVRLVTLSACETGISDARQSPDEYLGLAGGFLQAGAPAVVSSLWTVDDRSTALLMERFYRNHLEKGLAFPAALREAQLWLRDATRQEIGDYYKAFLRMSKEDAAAAAVEVFMGGPPGDRPYASPFYWAAFTFNGAGE